MSAARQQEQIGRFLRSLSATDAAGVTVVDQGADPVEELVWSALLWEAPFAKAERALKRVRAAVVDYNELRVCMPDEVVDLLGRGYPFGAERAAALLRSLHDVYRRQHKVTLEPLRDANKRDARKYLDSLDGLPRFVAARVMLVSLGGHAVPVDEQMRAALIGAGAIDAVLDLEQTASLLDRCVKATDALATHAAMLDWINAGALKKRSSGAGRSSKKRARKAATTG